MMNIIGQQDRNVAQLRDAARNANKMDGARYEALRAGIRREGFVQPVLVRDVGGGAAEIVDGHHRVQAARDLELAKVPCVVIDCTDEEAARIAISMNRLRGELDLSIVADVFSNLIDAGIDPDLLVATGFNQAEVDALVSAAQEATDDTLPRSMDEVEEQAADETVKPFIIELEFIDRETYQRAKRGLRRAAGKGNELSAGLMRLLGEEVQT